MTARRALFLSGSFGKGHDTLAEACAGALTPYGVESRIVDCMPMLGQGVGAFADWVFRKLLSITPVYDAFHFSQLRGDGLLGRFSDRAAVKVMLPHLRDEVDRFAPDLIVSVFATGAAAAVNLLDDHPDLTTIVFMTDSFAHRIWVHAGTDLFLVTSPLAAASVRRYWPQAQTRVINAPVRPEFYRAPGRVASRAALGVPADARCVLLISGAWGIGPLADIAQSLGQAGHWVLAIAGTNRRLHTELQTVADTHPNVMAFGFTDHIADLMAASDVIVTSSGDTCREARVVGRPLVLLDVVPGHGRENLMHELELGNAAVCSPTPSSVVGVVDSMLAETGSAGTLPVADAAIWDTEFIAALVDAGVKLEPRG